MFSDYKKQVLQAYKKKRELNQLSLKLLHPTAAKLRQECLVVLQDRYRPQDLRILKDFFEPKADNPDYMQLIRKYDREKFKPLHNYLRGETDDTEDKNVELLAWLIDFPDRPYQFRPNLQAGPATGPVDFAVLVDEQPGRVTPPAIVEMTVPLIDEASIPEEPDTIPVNSKGTVIRLPERNWHMTQMRNSLIVFLGLVLTGGIVYHYWPATVVNPYAHGCMFWKDDHFERSGCNIPMPVPLVPFDSIRLARFHAIKDQSTVTEASIGKVWYFKTQGHLELYTMAGFHPTDTARWLKPLTKYMYDKYLSHKNAPLLSAPLQSSAQVKP